MDLPEQRQQMLQMAEHWEKLSMDRLELIERHPELAHDGEHDEERTWQSGLR